jgi:hypothetical protein
MADKNINFKISVNSKEVDLTKTSFKDFQKIINQAKADLKSLPLTDPRYKTLNADIKAAEKAWTEAKKAAAEFGDENDKGAEKVKSYSAQIRAAKTELVNIEQQFGKNSQQYVDQANKIKALGDAQEELTRGTQKLDDALSNIPGPIGQVGQSMQQFENITQSAKSAMSSLIEQFPLLKNAFVASGIGAIVIFIGLLVAAVMKAAKSFEPLQQAFAAIGDAVSTFFDALKPITDFILNVFVSAINAAASVIKVFAEALGGTDAGFNQMTLSLEKNIKKQEALLNNYGSFLSKNYTDLLNVALDYNKKKKEILDDETKTQAKKLKELATLEYTFRVQIRDLKNAQNKEFRDLDNKFINESQKARIAGYDNERTAAIANAREEALRRGREADSEKKALNGRILSKMLLIKELQKQDAVANKDAIDALQQSIDDEKKLRDYKAKEESSANKLADAELKKLRRQWAREDVNAINERNIQILQAGTELILEENARNVQQAKDALVILKEQHRKEEEEVKLAGGTMTKLKEKQAAEIKLANEKLRLAEIQQNAYRVQLEIDANQRLVDEGAEGTKSYYDTRRKILEEEFQRELILADNNQNKILNARTNYYKQLTDLDIQQAQTEADLMQRKADTIGLINQTFYDGQIQAENARYDAEVKAAKDNYDLIEVLTAEHNKRLRDIDVAALEAKKQIEIAKYEIVAQVGALLQQIAGKNKDLAIAGVLIEKAAAIGQIWANNAIANAKATAASPLTFGQPWVTINTVSAALSTAATIAAAIQAVNQIKEAGSAATGGTGSGTGGAAAVPNYGRNYEEGGLIGGRRHAQGGTIIEAEQGEAIMTRGAVTMFAPMLSMMNQMGGGTSFINNAGSARPDNPAVKNPALQQEPLILKTYVVSSELTTEAQKQARLKDLSTL